MFKSCSIHLFLLVVWVMDRRLMVVSAVQRIKKNMAPVPYREGIDTEAKAPCWGAARHAVSDWSKQRVLICWCVHGRSLIVLVWAPTAGSFFCCSVVSRWQGCISLQRQKSSYKRDVGVKWSDVCSFSAPFNHWSLGKMLLTSLEGALTSASDIPYVVKGNFTEVWGWHCLCPPAFKEDLTQWGPESCCSEITQCLCSTAARR